MLDCIIVGAGAAGLAAAERLCRSGLSLLVLEARARIGGRVHTVFPSPSPPVELGAEFIHGKPDEIWRSAFSLKICDVPDTHFLSKAGRMLPVADFWQRLETVTRRLRRGGRDRSFDDFLKTLPRRLQGAGLKARAFVQSFHAADCARIGEHGLAALAKASKRYHEEKTFRPLDGYGKLMERFWRSSGLPAERLLRGVAVTEIRWGPREVRVRARRRRGAVEFKARRVLLTLPVGTLRSGSPRFIPEIESKRAALEGLEMGQVVKLILRFREAFWEKSAPDAAFFHAADGPFPVFWTALPLRAPLLTAWAGGPPAARLSALGESGILEAAVESVSKLFRISRRRARGELLSWHFHDWNRDPFSLGAYSYAAAGGASAHRRLARPLGPLFFAGEATNYDGQNATVSGAIASGRRAALEIIRAARKR